MTGRSCNPYGCIGLAFVVAYSRTSSLECCVAPNLPVEFRSESALVIAKFGLPRSRHNNRTALANANEGPPIFTVLASVTASCAAASLVCPEMKMISPPDARPGHASLWRPEPSDRVFAHH
jgi:hypothetical protein